MQRFLLVVVFIASALSLTAQTREPEINGCYITTCYGNETAEFEAFGNVFIETDPKEPVDLYVRVVDSPEEATYVVYKTTDTPKKCGEWCFVKRRAQAKFTIRYVKEYENIRVYFTKNRSKAGF